MTLKREISLLGAVFYGVGIILGAGIYALMGKAAGIAGHAVWLSFLLASITAVFTGFSYAELSSKYPRSSGEYLYVKEGLQREDVAFITGWFAILSSVIAMSAVALSFAGYINFWFRIPIMPAAVCLVLASSVINYIGIKESVKTNVILTLIETSGLILVILVGIGYYGKPNYLEMTNGLHH